MSRVFERLWQDAYIREWRIIFEAGRLAAAGHNESPIALFQLARSLTDAGDAMTAALLPPAVVAVRRVRAERAVAQFLRDRKVVPV